MAELGNASRQSEVSEQMNLVDKKLECIAETVAQLEERLNPALRKISPTPEGKDVAKEKELCTLAGALRVFHRKAQIILDKICSIKDRIEL